MNIRIEPPRCMRELATYLQKMNAKMENRVGYCGSTESEIYDTLVNDFSDLELEQSFAVAYQNDVIVGAIGLDIDKDDLSAEVWGPFISDPTMNPNLVNDLWEKVLEFTQVQFENFQFFLSKENSYGREFVFKQGGIERGLHSILIAKKSEERYVDGSGIKPYSPTDLQEFTELHNREFPNTYYNAKQIINRLSDTYKLYIGRSSDGKMQGYVYVEAQPAHQDGSIEYIAVLDDFRKQGIGTKLLAFALNELFQHDTIEEISLSVESENKQALNLYQAAGFEVMHELIHYNIKKF